MLTIRNITKNYGSGQETTKALKGVNLDFSENGLTAVLGPSGCGKTTLLNIIGGLDKYTDGDLLIDGKTTKEFKDSDWDAYRNAKIGFVFQSYNLIPHLSILENVAMALSLSGVSAKERREKSKEALAAVGLSEHLEKKPNQLSGGQMQRVAIARALVNNPSIILADEPTGALDSATSVQVMEILKEVSTTRLVIMVTHNRELADKYSDRIIEMRDGLVINDSNPLPENASESIEKMLNKHTKMSFRTALSSSFKNLLSKKVRTILISVAGSIGIVGVALVLAISNGMTMFLDKTEKDTLSGFPLSVSQTVAADFTMPDGNMNTGTFPTDNVFHAYDKSGSTTLHVNKITDEYLDYVAKTDESYYSAIEYNYAISKNVVSRADDGSYKLVDTSISSSDIFSTTSVFSEMPNNREFIESQYDLLEGKYPTEYGELALVVDKNNRIDTTILEQFGITIADDYRPDDLLGRSFKIVLNDDFYVKKSDGFYVAGNDYEAMYNSENSLTISITAIMRVKESSSSELLATGVNYTTALTKKLLSENKKSEIVVAQEQNPSINVLTGAPFFGQITYESVMRAIGGDATPVGIRIYPKNFEDKAKIKSYLDEYNKDKSEEDKIIYTDASETMSQTISSMVDTISVILIAFAAISLVVSTVMIGIITYVSVVERTKEIGIMRAIGARKRDITRIFNAETIIIGLASGVLGVILTYILSIPASSIISKTVGVEFTVLLQPYWAIALIGISVLLTLIAGFFPSRIAAKKDPVVALRTE